jgi:pentatricopeptide repeat protein
MYILKGAEYFQKAIDLDSEFALAHAGLADCYSLMASYGLVPPRTVMHKIKEAAETAIRLDDSICEPYCSMGFYYVSIEHNWKEAKKNFLQSLELNPNYAQAHYWYGWNYLAWIEGNFEEARKHGKLAISLEPLSSICYAIYSRILLDCANYQEALEASQKGLELEPNAYLCQLNEGNSYLFLNQYEQAESAFEVALKISQRHHYAINGLIWAYCKLGKRREAKALYKELKERSKSEYVGQTFTAISAAYLGELGEAIECLEKAYDDLDPVIVTVKNSNWFPNNLTQEERFQNLVHKIYPETNVFSDNLTGLS